MATIPYGQLPIAAWIGSQIHRNYGSVQAVTPIMNWGDMSTSDGTVWSTFFLGNGDQHLMYRKIAGTWTQMNKFVYIKIAGSWKQVPYVSRKIAGTWVRFDFIQSYN